MKISKLFHWLYASVMFLPLLAIPVFMIYSHRHSLTERTNVEINYKYQTNEVSHVNDLVEGNIYHSDSLYCEYGYEYSIVVLSTDDPSYDGDFSLDEYSLSGFDITNSGGLYFDSLTDYISITLTDLYSYGAFVQNEGNITFYDCDFVILSGLSGFIDNLEAYGNVVTSSTFNVIESVNADTTNENVMNVFFKDFAEFTDKYFNFDDVLSLHSITEWIDTNVFNGVTPLGFTIVWRYLEYWLIVSIFWLCFDVLIYVPQIAHRWLDKASLE